MISAYKDLKKIIRSYLLNEKIDKIDSNITDLYNLSLSLNVPCVIGYTLKNNNMYDPIFDKSIYKSINKYSSFSNFKGKIDVLFKSNNIKYMHLKGETIGRYYPEPYLRFSSDIDLIVHIDDYDKALYLLKNNLSFKEKRSSLNEITLINKEGINIDFHKALGFDEGQFGKMIEPCFKEYELDDEFKYIYLLEHRAKHFATGQLDLRFFIDLYYLRHKINRDKIIQSLKILHLDKFDKVLNSYLDYILLLQNPSDVDLKIEQYIISYSKDMGASNRVNNNENKAIFLIKHAFPSYKVMKGVFPVLENKPILLPWYYIVRIVRALKSGRKQYIANEFKGALSDPRNQLINELGISSYNK